MSVNIFHDVIFFQKTVMLADVVLRTSNVTQKYIIVFRAKVQNLTHFYSATTKLQKHNIRNKGKTFYEVKMPF
jgi:hypothetical protein